VYARDKQTVAQTDKSLVAAPGANRQIEVLAVVISVGAAMTVTLESGTTDWRAEFYLPANATVVLPAGESAYFRCAVNAALTYTSSAAGAVSVAVQYRSTRGSGA
jgi:hypothetical protein